MDSMASPPPGGSRTVQRATPSTNNGTRRKVIHDPAECASKKKMRLDTSAPEQPNVASLALPGLPKRPAVSLQCHELRGRKFLEVACTLPLEALEKICQCLPGASASNNLASAFISSNLGIRIKQRDQLQQLFKLVDVHHPSPIPMVVQLRNAERQSACCELEPGNVATARAPPAPVSRRAPMLCAAAVPAGNSLLAEAMGLSSRASSCDPRPGSVACR